MVHCGDMLAASIEHLVQSPVVPRVPPPPQRTRIRTQTMCQPLLSEALDAVTTDDALARSPGLCIIWGM